MKQQGYRMVRYADDFVVLCRTAEQAQAVLDEVKSWVEQNGLRLNADKTHVGDCRQAGQGFEFLGYRFEAGRRWVRPKSFKALRERIRMRTQRTRGDSLAKVIEDLNPMLRGWFNYFKQAHPLVHKWMDGFTRRRLRALLRKQEKRPGRGRCLADHLRWPNAFFATQGLFTMLRPVRWRANPDEETTDWRAVCGKTARTVRRAGTAKALPDPYHHQKICNCSNRYL